MAITSAKPARITGQGWGKKRLVARLRELATEHRSQPDIAADFKKLADDIEAIRVPGDKK